MSLTLCIFLFSPLALVRCTPADTDTEQQQQEEKEVGRFQMSFTAYTPHIFKNTLSWRLVEFPPTKNMPRCFSYRWRLRRVTMLFGSE